jgi:two-component system, NarL family, sensor kinase
MDSKSLDSLLGFTIVGTMLLLIMVSWIIIIAIQYRKRVVITRMERELTERRHRQELERQEAEAQERERQRIARDLHDAIGSALLITKRSLNEIGHDISGKKGERIRQLSQQMDEVIEGLHRIIAELSHPILDAMSLPEALRFYFHHLSQVTGTRITMKVNEESNQRHSKEVEIALYRVVQEIVANALKHACCKNIQIQWNQTPGWLTIEVSDDGIGFNIQTQHTGYGLTNLKNRIALCGGQYTLNSALNKGTQYSIRIPSGQIPNAPAE